MSKEFWHDNLFIDVEWILTKEEFESEVVFEPKLLDKIKSFNSNDQETLWCSILNNEEGFIQQGYPGKKAQHAISFKKGSNINSDIVLSFGELLINIDTVNRVNWKSFFKHTNCTINIAKKILFPQSDEDYELCADYWNKRRKDYNDVNDLPWMTPEEHDQIQKELSYLKHTWDKDLHMTKDMKTLRFNAGVLDKYKKNPHCELNISSVGLCTISFLNNNGDILLLSEFFFKTASMIMMYAKDFVSIPIREREYWNLFRIDVQEN